MVHGDEVETLNLGAVLIEVCVTHLLEKVETFKFLHSFRLSKGLEVRFLAVSGIHAPLYLLHLHNESLCRRHVPAREVMDV